MSDDEGQETLQEQGARYKAARQWQFGRGMVRLDRRPSNPAGRVPPAPVWVIVAGSSEACPQLKMSEGPERAPALGLDPVPCDRDPAVFPCCRIEPMAKPSDAAQALIDGISARAAAHKVKPAEVRAEPKECRFCGHPYLEPCVHPDNAKACSNTKLVATTGI